MELMALIKQLPAEDRAYIASLPGEQVHQLQRFFGATIRSQIRAGELQALFQWSRTQAAADARHLDDLAGPVLYEVWTTLRASHGVESSEDD